MAYRRGVRALRPRSYADVRPIAESVRTQLAPGLGWDEQLDLGELLEQELTLDVGDQVVRAEVFFANHLSAHDAWAVTTYDAGRGVFEVALCDVTARELTEGVPRSRWSVAHELGHVAVHHAEVRAGVFLMHRRGDPVVLGREWDLESQANMFAAELLMPTQGVAGQGADELAARFGVSAVAARLRLGEI